MVDDSRFCGFWEWRVRGETWGGKRGVDGGVGWVRGENGGWWMVVGDWWLVVGGGMGGKGRGGEVKVG